MNMPSKLNNNIITHEDFVRTKTLLEKLKQAIFKKEGFGELGNNFLQLSQEYDLKLPTKNEIDHNSDDNGPLAEAITNLITQLDSMKYVTVSIAFTPRRPFLTSLKLMLEELYKIETSFYLKTILDPTLVAGILIDFEGKHLDLSLNKKIEEYVNAKL